MADPLFSINDVMKFASTKVAMEGWVALSWKHAEGGSVVEGEMPVGFISRGPRKGCPKFGPLMKPTKRTVVVSDAEMLAHALNYERETGVCWDCKGTKQNTVGWSKDEGIKYSPCRRCSATGVAPTPAVAA